MHITEHAKERAYERFGIPAHKILGVFERPGNESFDIIDRKKSYDESVDVGPKKVVVARSPKAYFVVDADNRLVTVLTESQAMHNIKCGKWTRSPNERQGS